MKRINTIMIMILLVCFAGSIKAQSIRWADTNEEYARKIGDNLYEPVPAGVVSYKVENNKFFLLANGELEGQKGHLSRKGDIAYYFNGEDQMVGYYKSKDKVQRYTIVEPGSGKEDECAVLYEGTLYLFGKVKYKVDDSFSPDVLGFFLFVH
ncbi:hypothetical protein [Dysgonomonas termitidis]|uniref:Uncharacterized protein n=1 Tax=Dysgonomonas termitidis TaxID=1516126 RepID=A0ABV9KU79_9BACT